MPPSPSDPRTIPSPRNVIRRGNRSRRVATAATTARSRIAPPTSTRWSIISSRARRPHLRLDDVENRFEQATGGEDVLVCERPRALGAAGGESGADRTVLRVVPRVEVVQLRPRDPRDLAGEGAARGSGD